MPDACGKLLDILSVGVDARHFASLTTRIKAGTQLLPPAPIFPRYVEPAEAT
jgi:methionyl-tRNA synthetase